MLKLRRPSRPNHTTLSFLFNDELSLTTTINLTLSRHYRGVTKSWKGHPLAFAFRHFWKGR
jgi:hypothetical protein